MMQHRAVAFGRMASPGAAVQLGEVRLVQEQGQNTWYIREKQQADHPFGCHDSRTSAGFGLFRGAYIGVRGLWDIR